MSNDSNDTFDEMIAKYGKNSPKNPKGSARQKFNRRKLWLAHALNQMDIAIDDLLSQEGTVYKQQEIDTLKVAIAEFRNTTGLKMPEMVPPSQEDLDGFMDMLTNLQPWEPPSKEELANLYVSIELATQAEEDESDGPSPDCLL